MKPFDPGLFFVGRLFINSKSAPILFLLKTILIICVFAGICPVHLAYLICLHVIIFGILLLVVISSLSLTRSFIFIS